MALGLGWRPDEIYTVHVQWAACVSCFWRPCSCCLGLRPSRCWCRMYRSAPWRYIIVSPVRSCFSLARSFIPMAARPRSRSEEHTSELQSLMRISYAVFCLKKKIYFHPHYYIFILTTIHCLTSCTIFCTSSSSPHLQH